MTWSVSIWCNGSLSYLVETSWKSARKTEKADTSQHYMEILKILCCFWKARESDHQRTPVIWITSMFLSIVSSCPRVHLLRKTMVFVLVLASCGKKIKYPWSGCLIFMCCSLNKLPNCFRKHRKKSDTISWEFRKEAEKENFHLKINCCLFSVPQ